MSAVDDPLVYNLRRLIRAVDVLAHIAVDLEDSLPAGPQPEPLGPGRPPVVVTEAQKRQVIKLFFANGRPVDQGGLRRIGAQVKPPLSWRKVAEVRDEHFGPSQNSRKRPKTLPDVGWPRVASNQIRPGPGDLPPGSSAGPQRRLSSMATVPDTPAVDARTAAGVDESTRLPETWLWDDDGDVCSGRFVRFDKAATREYGKKLIMVLDVAGAERSSGCCRRRCTSGSATNSPSGPAASSTPGERVAIHRKAETKTKDGKRTYRPFQVYFPDRPELDLASEFDLDQADAGSRRPGADDGDRRTAGCRRRHPVLTRCSPPPSSSPAKATRCCRSTARPRWAATASPARRQTRPRSPAGSDAGRRANIGLRCDGLCVVDVDGDPGEQSLDQLERRLGPLPLTRAQATGKGRHMLYAAPVELGNSTGPLGQPAGIDLRCGKRGYIVAAPAAPVRAPLPLVRPGAAGCRPAS